MVEIISFPSKEDRAKIESNKIVDAAQKLIIFLNGKEIKNRFSNSEFNISYRKTSDLKDHELKKILLNSSLIEWKSRPEYYSAIIKHLVNRKLIKRL